MFQKSLHSCALDECSLSIGRVGIYLKKALTLNLFMMPMISFFRDADDKTKGSLERLVNIWKERGVFDKEVIYAIKDKLKGEFSDKTVFTICISPKNCLLSVTVKINK